jgi:PAS domain S-box-containing protein
MSSHSGLLDASAPSSRSNVYPYPSRTLIILAILIFLAELFSMLVLYFLRIPNYVVESLLDGIIMLVFILPILYFLQLKPLSNQLEERAQAEKALRDSEALFRRVLELLPVGVWIIDKNRQIADGNSASQHIWSGDRQVGVEQSKEYKGWLAATGKRIGPQEWAAARAIIRGETTLNEEVEIEALDGSRKIILDSAVPILNERNTILGAVVVNQDITERRMAEKERIRANELLERFFSSIYTLIAYMDRDFNFIRVNDTYARAGGHPPEFFIGRNHFDLYPHEENEAIFRRVVETGEPFSVLEKPFEYPEFPERGVTYWDWSLQPVKGVNGEIEGAVLSLVDVTERKLSDIKLEHKNQELRELYEAESAARQFAETLSATAQALTQTLDLDHVINTLLDHLHQVVPSDTAGVILLEAESRPTVHALRGYGNWVDREDIPSLPIEGITDSIIRRLELARNSLAIPNLIDPAMGDQTTPERICNWLIVPIIASDKIIGLVELGRAGAELFIQKQIRWAEALASQAAVAIQNAWLFEQVRSSSDRLQSLARKLVEIQENERFNIARELHDEAGQAISSLKLSLGRLEQDPDCTPSMRQRLHDLKGVADGVLDELHRLVMDLRPVALDHLGLVPALQQYVSNLNSEQLSVQFKAVGFEGDRLVRDAETSLYRIVQEALTNVVSHAHANNIGILLERAGGKVKVFVEDDGVGFSPDFIEQKERLGLVGMRERAEMMGGRLIIESVLGKGTSVIVEVPDVYSDPYRG